MEWGQNQNLSVPHPAWPEGTRAEIKLGKHGQCEFLDDSEQVLMWDLKDSFVCGGTGFVVVCPVQVRHPRVETEMKGIVGFGTVLRNENKFVLPYFNSDGTKIDPTCLSRWFLVWVRFCHYVRVRL